MQAPQLQINQPPPNSFAAHQQYPTADQQSVMRASIQRPNQDVLRSLPQGEK
jgi:hypothetical protein